MRLKKVILFDGDVVISSNTKLSLLLQMPIAQEPLATSQGVGVLLISQDRVSSSAYC